MPGSPGLVDALAHNLTPNPSASTIASDLAARLPDICARVAELHRRIQAEHDPKAVAELCTGAVDVTAGDGTTPDRNTPTHVSPL